MTGSPFHGRVAVVTGGSRGIGREISLKLGVLGAHVVVNHTGRDSGRAQAVAEEIRKRGGAASEHACDVGDEAAVSAMFGAIAAQLGRIDILVCNAALDARASVRDLSYAIWRELFRVNVDGAFLCVRHAAQVMVDAGGGRIILIGSVNGRLGWRDRTAYAATKGALEAFARAAAWDLGPHGITVNVVAPGAVDTEMWQGGLTVEVSAAMAKRVPIGRLGTGQDVAATVAFLASDDASFITGSTVYVDGGRANTDYVPLPPQTPAG